ncbi:MAG: 23S rRNA (adenine(2503)-C(2))-methyltransferase RlmN [Candidatus Zixiibacteriota bacterium]
MGNDKTEIMGLKRSKIIDFFNKNRIEQDYRADQILRWIYNHRVMDFEEMSNLPGRVRDVLKKNAKLTLPPEVEVFRDGGTIRFVFQDGNDDAPAVFEAVLITDERTDSQIRKTVCISSQAGCNLGCSFCATGRMGFKRNLTASEIIGQLYYIASYETEGQPITNVVFMGMGEPLQNLENVIDSIEIIKSDPGFGIGARKITVSSAGLVPEILKLAESGHKVRLAISLNASNDKLRKELMPIAERYSIDEILEAVETFYEATGRWVTLEYVMMEGINDSVENAKELAEKIGEHNVKVNLIPYNPVEGLDYRRPELGIIQQFQARLLANGVTATIRNSQGSNIDAACGQLAGRSL